MAMYLDEARVRALLHWDALIAAMESALAAFSSGRVIQPVRNMITIEEGRRYLGIMPAVAEDVMPGQCRHRGSDASGHDRPASLGHR
jgi:ornithine cyclodeaminase/alanine dehydrogenase-like protein (mu-crystallin family)